MTLVHTGKEDVSIMGTSVDWEFRTTNSAPFEIATAANLEFSASLQDHGFTLDVCYLI